MKRLTLLVLCTLLTACATLHKPIFYQPSQECARKTLKAATGKDDPRAHWLLIGNTYYAESGDGKTSVSPDPPFAECK